MFLKKLKTIEKKLNVPTQNLNASEAFVNLPEGAQKTLVLYNVYSMQKKKPLMSENLA